jgi:hypothetical protein
METFTDQDLIAELLEISPRYTPRHGGVTAQEWAEAKGVCISNAHAFLRRQVAAGKLRVEDNWSDTANRSIKVYYRNSV